MMAEFVSGSFDSVVFWESKTFSKRRTETPFINSACHLSSLTWSSSNGKLAVVPRQGDRVALCEFQDGETTWTYLSHQDGGRFCSGCLLLNSRYLASGSEDSSVHIWDLKNPKMFKTFLGHTSPVTSIAHHHSDHWIVSGGRDGAIIMHSVESTSGQFLQGPSDQAINQLCFSHVESGQFGSVSADGVACLWSVESQRLLNKYSPSHTGPATDLCFSPSTKLMISVGMDSRIKCYDILNRKIATEASVPSPLSSVTMLTDGTTLLAGGADGKLYVYELRTMKYPKATLEGHKTAITCVTQQSNSRYSHRSKSSRSSSSKGKNTPSSQLSDGGAEYSPQLGSANNSPANHLDEMPSAISPVVRTDQPNTTQTSSSSGLFSSKRDSVNITPFVTTQAPGKVEGGAKQLTSVGESTATVFATPASQRAQTSSIFSPLDPNLVTPAPGIRVIVPGTTLATPTTTVATPTPSALPTGNQLPSATRSHPTAPTSETSSIFSPLDDGQRLLSASSRQPVASPLLIAHTQPERKVVAGGEVHGGQHRMNSNGDSGRTKFNVPVPSVTHDECDGGVAGGGVKSKALIPTTGQSQLADMLERQSLETPSQPSNPALSSTHSMFSSLPDSATSSSAGLLDSVENNNADETEHRGAMVAPPPSGAAAPCNNIQMKYLESMIKDAHEETCQALHRDIRALSVDNIKFFCSLQQQLASQHTALMEKVDRLTEELRRVEEMVHQYMPKH